MAKRALRKIKASWPLNLNVLANRMRDWIVSGKAGEIYSEVEIHKSESIDHFYVGEIIEYNFPDDLYVLINEHDEIIRSCSIALLDEVEEKLCEYKLKLKLLNVKIFDLSIKEKKKIEFFTKFPTSSGFMDDYPC